MSTGGWTALIEGGEATSSALFNIFQAIYLERAIKESTKQQLRAVDAAQKIAERYGEQALAYLASYGNYGEASMNKMTALVDAGYFDWDKTGADVGKWEPPAFDFKADPGYAFRLYEGQKAIESSAAARGTGLSGATQKALARYSQDMASSEYDKAYRRYMAQRQQDFSEYVNTRNFLYQKWSNERAMTANRLQSGINLGYSAASARSAVAGGLGDTLASMALRRGDIKAAKATALGNLGASIMYNQGMINDEFFNAMGGGSRSGVPMSVNYSGIGSGYGANNVQNNGNAPAYPTTDINTNSNWWNYVNTLS